MAVVAETPGVASAAHPACLLAVGPKPIRAVRGGPALGVTVRAKLASVTVHAALTGAFGLPSMLVDPGSSMRRRPRSPMAGVAVFLLVALAADSALPPSRGWMNRYPVGWMRHLDAVTPLT